MLQLVLIHNSSRKKRIVPPILSIICVLSLIVPSSGCVYLVHNNSNIVLWKRAIPNSDNTSILKMVADSSSIYLTGYRHYTLPSKVFRDNTVVMKYDMNGLLVWDRIWGKDFENWGGDILLHDSAIYIWGIRNLNDAQASFILKYDLNGNLLWNLTVNGSYETSRISMDSQFIYLSGHNIYRNLYLRLFMDKYDLSGNHISSKIWTTSILDSPEVQMEAISTSIYVGAVIDIYGHGWTGTFIVDKFDMANNETWNHSIGKSYIINASMISVDPPLFYSWGEIDSPESGNIVLSRFDANGSLLWNRTVETGKGGSIYSVALDSHSVYLLGKVREKDFILKYSSNGYLQWKKNLGKTSHFPCETCIAVNPTGIYNLSGENSGLYIIKIANT